MDQRPEMFSSGLLLHACTDSVYTYLNQVWGGQQGESRQQSATDLFTGKSYLSPIRSPITFRCKEGKQSTPILHVEVIYLPPDSKPWAGPRARMHASAIELLPPSSPHLYIPDYFYRTKKNLFKERRKFRKKISIAGPSDLSHVSARDLLRTAGVGGAGACPCPKVIQWV